MLEKIESLEALRVRLEEAKESFRAGQQRDTLSMPTADLNALRIFVDGQTDESQKRTLLRDLEKQFYALMRSEEEQANQYRASLDIQDASFSGKSVLLQVVPYDAREEAFEIAELTAQIFALEKEIAITTARTKLYRAGDYRYIGIYDLESGLGSRLRAAWERGKIRRGESGSQHFLANVTLPFEIVNPNEVDPEYIMAVVRYKAVNAMTANMKLRAIDDPGIPAQIKLAYLAIRDHLERESLMSLESSDFSRPLGEDNEGHVISRDGIEIVEVQQVSECIGNTRYSIDIRPFQSRNPVDAVC